MQSENTADLSAALAKAQATMKATTFNKVNPHFKINMRTFQQCLRRSASPLPTTA